MHTRDLDDVVALLAQGRGNGPAAIGGDMQDHDPQTEILHFGNDLGKVLVGAGNKGIANRAALGERHQVAPQLALDTLASSRASVDEPQLEPGHLGQRIVLGGTATLSDLVPVASQHWQPGPIPRQSGEQLEQASVVPGDGIPTARAMNGHGAICEGIACINE